MLEPPPAPWACHPIKYAVPEDLAKGSDAAKYTRLTRTLLVSKMVSKRRTSAIPRDMQKHQLTISQLCCSQGQRAALPGSY